MDTPSPLSESLLNEEQAASLMSVSPRTLQAWRTRGGGPAFVRVGSRIRYCPHALAAWFKARSATAAHTRKAKPIRLACRPTLPPRMVDLVAGELARGFAGEVAMSATAYRRLSQALGPHEATLALALCREGEARPDGTVRLVVPRNFATPDAHLDPRRMTFAVTYDPRSGQWISEASAGRSGFDGLCAHVWRIQGRTEGMAARDLLAHIGAAYLALLSEREAA